MVALKDDYVSAQFPSLAAIRSRGMSYFDSASRSLPSRYSIWRLNRAYNDRMVIPDAPNAVSEIVSAEIDEARDRMARMFGVRTDELHFGPSTAGNVYVLARAFWEVLAPGSAIIVSDQDHEANSGPWRRLADFGIRVLPWKMDPATGRLDPAELERMLDDSVRLVCFPHCSSVIGEIHPVAEITALVRRAGAVSCVDGAAFAPHEIPNLHRLGADIYLMSAYKLFGPHVGLMVVRRAVAAMLRYQGPDDFAQPLVRRLLPASQDYPQIAACVGIADYIDAVYAAHFKAGRDATGRAVAVSELMVAHERRRLDPLVEFLAQRPGVRVLGPQDGVSRVALVSFSHPRRSQEIAADLAAQGIIAGAGHLGSAHALQAMKLDPLHGVVRLSLSHYTTDDDMTRLMDALDQVL